MTEEEIKAKLAEVVEVMSGKGLQEPRASLEIYTHERTTGWVGSNGGLLGGTFLRGDTALEALDKLADWAQTRPSIADQKFEDALAKSAKAVEALKEAGAEGAETAAFVAQLEASMKALSHNILEDRR